MSGKQVLAVDDYFESLTSDEVREALMHLRKLVLEAAPRAEESISYGIPTYKLHGFVASIGAFKRHYSFFPGHTTGSFQEELKPYKVLKGTVQFRYGEPLPEDLIRRMVVARVEENLASAD